MNNLIIGHRGFVGSNLCRQIQDAIGAGRAEISSLVGEAFSNIYCAAPQAKKWWANQNPAQDRQEVDNLIADCRQLSCRGHFVLFSTVDVYDPPFGKTELDQPRLDAHPYGANRYYLEQCILQHFGSKAKVIRLPGLVGHGLKKNIIFDLLNNNNIEQINANSAFQWFNLDLLGEALEFADQLDGPSVINAVSEPLSTAELVRAWFPQDLDRLNWKAPPVAYDIKTIHGKLDKPYFYSRDEVLARHLEPFIQAEGAMR